MCSAYRESCVFLWGQFEEAGKNHVATTPRDLASQEHYILQDSMSFHHSSPSSTNLREIGRIILSPFHRWGN